MIPALISSVTILYLYWRLNAEERPDPAQRSGAVEILQNEFARLSARLEAIQARLSRPS